MYLFAPSSEVKDNTVFTASTLPNNLYRAEASPSTEAYISWRKVPNPLDCIAVLSNWIPNSFAYLVASTEGFAIDDKVAFKPVIDSEVAIPCAVVVAKDANTSSIATPAPFAVGATLPIDAANSSTVVLPRFCVSINSLAIFSVSSKDKPYAFIIVEAPSTAVSKEVKPASASLFNGAIKVSKSPVDTLALKAW